MQESKGGCGSSKRWGKVVKQGEGEVYMVHQGDSWGDTNGIDMGDKQVTGEDIIYNNKPICIGDIDEVLRLGKMSNIIEN